jgi:hypothetical protein
MMVSFVDQGRRALPVAPPVPGGEGMMSGLGYSIALGPRNSSGLVPGVACTTMVRTARLGQVDRSVASIRDLEHDHEAGMRLDHVRGVRRGAGGAVAGRPFWV